MDKNVNFCNEFHKLKQKFLFTYFIITRHLFITEVILRRKMKIQPTHNTILTRCFGNKQVNTKLPRSLQAKPKHKPPKGLLISLIPISLLSFGIYYWQIHKEEANERSNKFWLRELFKQWGAEELYDLIFGEKTPDDNTNETSQNAISMWKTLSNTPIKTPNTITLQEALEKYGVQNMNLTQKHESKNISWHDSFFEYVKQPKSNAETHAGD